MDFPEDVVGYIFPFIPKTNAAVIAAIIITTSRPPTTYGAVLFPMCLNLLHPFIGGGSVGKSIQAFAQGIPDSASFFAAVCSVERVPGIITPHLGQN